MGGPGPEEERLESLSTPWTLLRRACRASPEGARPALHALVLRYHGAIRRYLLGILRDPDAADEVCHDLIIRMMQGEFQGADQERGRFRDYLKTSVRNAALGHLRRRRTVAAVESAGDRESNAVAWEDDRLEDAWRDECRAVLLEGAWVELEAVQVGRPGSVAYTLLRLRADHPADDARALAARLEAASGRRFSGEAMRQQLHRARILFGRIVAKHAGAGLDSPSADRVDEELADLGLLEYLRDVGRAADGKAADLSALP